MSQLRRVLAGCWRAGQIRAEKAADADAHKLHSRLSSADIRYLYQLKQKSASDGVR